MGAFFVALGTFIAGSIIAKLVAMFVVVIISTSLVSFTWGQVESLLISLSGNPNSAVMMQILGLAGVGEFLGIVFGAFALKASIGSAIKAAV